MIRKLEIRNFKSHLNTQVELGDLTVLTGMNSAGKSSLVQTLLLLRQTYQKGRLREGLVLNGDLCAIGNGNSARYRLADSGRIEFYLAEDAAEVRLAYDAGEGKEGNDFLDLAESHVKIPCVAENGDVSALPENVSLFSDAFQYVSALRWGGKSHFGSFNYEVEKHQQISVRLGQGEAVAHYLYKYGNDKVSFYFEEDDWRDGENETCDETPRLFEQVQNWERRISRDITVDVKEVTEGPDKGFNVVYGHKFPGTKAFDGLDAANVGYGLSHALPVLVALLSAKPGALIVLENPEAHLHPRGQAELAKLISRVAAAGVQVIVETHSDHIINGILVASKRFEDKKLGIDKNMVRLYHFDKDVTTQMHTVPEEVKIVGAGRLDHQPAGFFDQAEADLLAMNGL